MRKLLTILFILIGFAGFAQPIVNRAGQANTVQDARLAAQYNFFLPRYSDTTSANTQKGIDTCGALIFTYDYNGFWYRQCSPKKWVQIFANSPSPSSDTLVWKLSGNSVGLRQATPVLGTLDGYDLNFMTNGATRLSIPSGGLVRNSAATVKYLSFDTITKQMYYGDGGTPSTPTWQQTLTAGSTITSDVNITSGTQDINWVGTTGVWDQSMEAFGWTASKSGRNSVLALTNDSISINPGFGNIHIDTLLNRSNQNALMGWDSTGTDRGQVGYVTLGSGLSLSSGVLNTSGTVPTPISSLTAATGTNSIDNAAFQQQWSWNTLNGAGLYLFSSSTASTGSNHRLLQVSTDGANAAASATTFGALIENDHTGTTSTNIGISASASSGTTNIAGRFEASGGTTSIGGQFSSSGGTTNYGITGSVTGAATTNYGAEFSASGGTTNNALNIAAGALTLNGSAGTSGQVLTSAGANTLPTWTTPSSGGTPGGSDTYIQFNDGGSFGGDAGFTYNKTTNVFSTNNGAYRPTGTISFSDAGAGSVYKSSSDGLVLRAVTGSGYDFMIYDASGAGIFGNQTGTSQLGSTSQMGAGLLGYGSWNAWMNLRGGTTTNASLTIRDGVAPSSPAEGQIWRTTDKVYNVIQTGAATKEFTLNDIALTSGRIPYTTTNGRLTDTATFLRSPGGSVSIGTSSPSASALLDVSSTTKGVLIPRMTTTERNAISTPSVGLMIYNTTDSAFNYYRLSGWTAIGGGGGSSLFPTTGTGTATGSIVADMASQSVTVTHTTGGAATNAFRPYKVYTALLTQSGTSAPTVDALLENTLGGSISWAYTSAGTYDGTLSGAFLSNKVFGINGIAGIDDTQVAAYTIQRIDNNTIRIQCSIYPSIGLSDNVLSATSIEIRVYY